ncbi:MAG: nucleoid-associated protein [Bacteroidales bacterium]|nr:nucleoid-associated protein [Bacteroidales bacterium]
MIQNIVLHIVGNKSAEDGLFLSKSPLVLNDDLKEVLNHYFLTPFHSEEYFQLYHDSGLQFNVVYDMVSQIFENQEVSVETSVNLAKHLYEQSVHPKIKGGEFYIVYFNDCMLEGETVDAVGLFKSENKDTFLKVLQQDDNYRLESENGININKLDKGCLIFNSDKAHGFVVSIVDNTNRGIEAQYWIDDFLHVRQRQDNYFNTHALLSSYKKFVTKTLPKEFDVCKADQADLLNKSVQFFKEKDNFDLDEFSQEVIQQPEVIERFQQFKNQYQEDNDIDFPDSFSISETAVKKQARAFKSIIKLDKNFHIYVHGNRSLIEQGEDEKGKFYKVYYKEEN